MMLVMMPFYGSESLVTICSLSSTDEISHDYNDDEDEQHHTYTNSYSVVRLVGFAQVDYSNKKMPGYANPSTKQTKNPLKTSMQTFTTWLFELEMLETKVRN